MAIVELSELIGKVVSEIKNESDEILFIMEDGTKYKMFHEQDCCESVSIDDINGDLQDLVGSPIIKAEEVSNEQFDKDWESKFEGEGWDRKGKNGGYYPESHTWTFYKFATIKGYVDVRWFGESNGYYSESVDFYKANEEGKFSYWD